MGFFSKKPKPSKELIEKLAKIASLKASLPLKQRSKTSGSGRIYVQWIVDQRSQKFAQIGAGNDMVTPAIVFWLSIHSWDDGFLVYGVNRYVPGEWEQLVDGTLEVTRKEFLHYLRKNKPDINKDDLEIELERGEHRGLLYAAIDTAISIRKPHETHRK